MTEPNELCESERLRKLPFRGDDSIEEDEVEEKDGDRKLLLLLVLLLVGLSVDSMLWLQQLYLWQ